MRLLAMGIAAALCACNPPPLSSQQLAEATAPERIIAVRGSMEPFHLLDPQYFMLPTSHIRERNGASLALEPGAVLTLLSVSTNGELTSDEVISELKDSTAGGALIGMCVDETGTKFLSCSTFHGRLLDAATINVVEVIQSWPCSDELGATQSEEDFGPGKVYWCGLPAPTGNPQEQADATDN